MANPNPSPATRFKPGHTGNANGRPAGRRFIDELEEFIDEKQARPALKAKFLSMLLSGDGRAWKEYLDRRDGKPRDFEGHDPQSEDSPATDEHGNHLEP